MLLRIAKYWRICYFYYYLFIGALWNPALRCDDFLHKFGFLLYWLFHTYNSQVVLMYFCVHIPLLSLCCRPHLLIFLRCSLAFVILHVSTLLVFMPLFSELCLLFCCSSPTERPYGLLTSHTLARYPRHIIEVLATCILRFFYLFIIHFVFLFYFDYDFFFFWTNTVGTVVAKTAKSDLRFWLFVILLFLLPHFVSSMNKDLQRKRTRPHKL